MAGFFLWYKSFPNVRRKFLSDKLQSINMIRMGELNLNMTGFFFQLSWSNKYGGIFFEFINIMTFFFQNIFEFISMKNFFFAINLAGFYKTNSNSQIWLAFCFITVPGYNTPKNFPCGAIAKKKQTQNIYNLVTKAAARLRAILN